MLEKPATSVRSDGYYDDAPQPHDFLFISSIFTGRVRVEHIISMFFSKSDLPLLLLVHS